MYLRNATFFVQYTNKCDVRGLPKFALSLIGVTVTGDHYGADGGQSCADRVIKQHCNLARARCVARLTCSIGIYLHVDLLLELAKRSLHILARATTSTT